MTKRILILVALSLSLCWTASAFQGGGGESTKNKANPKKNSGTKSVSTTPPRPTAPAARPKTPTVASLMVNSNLPDVTVTINGRRAGTTDSNGYVMMGSMKPGAYTVSVTKPGYHPQKIVINLSPGQNETLNLALKPITQALTISSTPPECEVYVDDVLLGRTDASGNARLAEVAVGEHRITVRKARYRDAVFPLSLSPDQEGRIEASLELAVGFLTVKTNTPKANIAISGIGQLTSPVDRFECQAGTYSVTISSPLYITSKKEVSVSAGKEAQLSVDLEADSEARDRQTSAALEAYSRKQYDRAIGLAKTLLSADPKHSRALTVLAESYFMKDEWNSFAESARQTVEAGGRVEVSLRHHHGLTPSSMHPVRLVIDATNLSFDPQLTERTVCSNKPFSVPLQVLRTAELSGNLENEIYLRLIFADPDNPKKTSTLRFADRESSFVKGMKTTAGGLVGYSGEIMVSRPQALRAITAIADLMNSVKTKSKRDDSSVIASPDERNVILEMAGSRPSAEKLPALESIVEANIKALGGKENLEKWTTLILNATYTVTKGAATSSGTVEEYWKGRNKILQVWSQEGTGVVQEDGYDGAVGWVKEYKRKPRPMSASEVASVKEGLLLLSLAEVKEFREMYPTSKLQGRGKLGERNVFVVLTTSSDGRPQTLYFDVVSGLLARWDSTYEDPNKKGQMLPVKILYDDYADVGGKNMPTAWRQVAPTYRLTIKIQTHRYDVPIDDAKFKMPTK